VVSIRGTNVEVSGITIRGACHWTIVPRNRRNVTVRDVKICGVRIQNDDGINPCNSQDVRITDGSKRLEVGPHVSGLRIGN